MLSKYWRISCTTTSQEKERRESNNRVIEINSPYVINTRLSISRERAPANRTHITLMCSQIGISNEV